MENQVNNISSLYQLCSVHNMAITDITEGWLEIDKHYSLELFFL